jgi:hypothetical protein
VKAEEEARRKAAEEAQRKAEEAKKMAAEEEARRRQEAEERAAFEAPNLLHTHTRTHTHTHTHTRTPNLLLAVPNLLREAAEERRKQGAETKADVQILVLYMCRAFVVV